MNPPDEKDSRPAGRNGRGNPPEDDPQNLGSTADDPAPAAEEPAPNPPTSPVGAETAAAADPARAKAAADPRKTAPEEKNAERQEPPPDVQAPAAEGVENGASVENGADAPRSSPGDRDAAGTDLDHCRIPLGCEIARFDLSLAEVRTLRPGQILTLPIQDMKSLTLRSAGQNLARCECVRNEDGNLAIRILEVADTGDGHA